jgi:HSP20 family protein
MKKHRLPKTDKPKTDKPKTDKQADEQPVTNVELEPRHDTTVPADWFGRWFDDLWRGRGVEGREPMRVEEFRDGDTLVVKAEMPGMNPDEDVEISVSDHTLRIRAERRQESKVEEKHGYRSEFRYGSFVRSVPLPVGATDEDVKATYKDGVLEVRVPIDQQTAEARKVPVHRA